MMKNRVFFIAFELCLMVCYGALFADNLESERIFFQVRDPEAIALDLGVREPEETLALAAQFYHVIALNTDSDRTLAFEVNQNITVFDAKMGSTAEKERVTFKQLLFDSLFSRELLKDRKVGFIQCDLKGKEETFLEDLLYFAYYNQTKVRLFFSVDAWQKKTLADFEYLLKFFRICDCPSAVCDYILQHPLEPVLLEPLPDAGVLIKREMPVIIIGYNLFTCIRQMVEQMEKYTSDIIVIDNNSTFPPLLEYYEKEFRYTLLKMPVNRGAHVFHDPFIQRLLGSIYLVTDPDLQFNPCLPDDFIQVLIAISNRYGADRVGFALGIDCDDLREDLFLLYDNIVYSVSEWEKRFWENLLIDPEYPQWELYESDVDTTFCLMNRQFADDPYRLRIAGDFTCKHLPWHIGFLSSLLEGEGEYYRKNNLSSTWKNE